MACTARITVGVHLCKSAIKNGAFISITTRSCIIHAVVNEGNSTFILIIFDLIQVDKKELL